MELVSLCKSVFGTGCITAVYGLLEFKFVFLSNLGRVCKDGSMYCNNFLLCMVLSILIYCREREGKRVHGIASGRQIAVCSFGGKHVSIFAHEGYKFYVLGGMGGIFWIVASAISMHMAEGIPSHTGTTEIQAYRYYIEQLQGTYTEETRAWLEQETQIMQMTDQEALETQEQFQNGEISLETYTDWMEKRQQLIEMRSRGFYKIFGTGTGD